MAKKAITKPKHEDNGDSGTGLYALAKAVEGLGELPSSYKVEEIADNIAGLASEVGILAHVSAMATIAQYGTEADRQSALAYLKRHFERGTFEEE